MKHHNALGDLLYSDKKHDEEMAKLDALNKIAGRTTASSGMIYAVLGVTVLIAGIIVIVAIKRKKS